MWTRHKPWQYRNTLYIFTSDSYLSALYTHFKSTRVQYLFSYGKVYPVLQITHNFDQLQSFHCKNSDNSWKILQNLSIQRSIWFQNDTKDTKWNANFKMITVMQSFLLLSLFSNLSSAKIIILDNQKNSLYCIYPAILSLPWILF